MDKSSVYKQKSQAAFDKQANLYDSTYYGQHAQKLYDCVIETMNRYAYKNVLDIGCGTGNILAEILKRNQAAVAGIDLSEKMLSIARDRIGNEADLRNGDSEHLPWNSGQFDIVICTDSFHHYPNPKAVVKEMSRVLNPAGRIIIADPWMPTPFRQIANLFMPFNKDGDIKMYSEADMKKILGDCGLKLESWCKAGKHAFVMVAGK